MQKSITPIIILGAARNGTTSLENMINTFPEVAKIEHELHHGSHEAKLYGYYRFYGDIKNLDKYIDFVYHYSSEDYFQLADGSVEYHLRNRKSDFFQFFFDLMDRYCALKGKQFWTVKLEPAFFSDKKVFDYLLKLLKNRYSSLKIIRIQRNVFSALLSARHMEGREHIKRRRWFYRKLHLFIYTTGWYKTYLNKDSSLAELKMLDISFEDFVTNEVYSRDQIRKYLDLSKDFAPAPRDKMYSINTSFLNKDRDALSAFEKLMVSIYLRVLKTFPSLVHYISFITRQTLYRNPSNPMHRRLVKSRFFKNELITELKEQGAVAIVKILE